MKKALFVLLVFSRLSFGQFREIGGPSGSQGLTISDLSDRGELVGYYRTSTGGTPYVWDGKGFQVLGFPGALDTEGHGIEGGFVVGTYMVANGQHIHGFTRIHGKYTTLDVPGALLTVPEGVNQKGQIVGFYQNVPTLVDTAAHPADWIHGFVWERGVFTTVDLPPSFGTFGGLLRVADTMLEGINDDGRIVGQFWSLGAGRGSFTWSNGEFTILNPGVPVRALCALKINKVGDIVGFVVDLDARFRGFAILNGKFTIVDYPEANSQTFLTGINDRGLMAGYYYLPELAPGATRLEFGAFTN